MQAYIAAMPGWKRDIGKRLDALIARTVPRVRKAVKWNSPFYGVEGQGWFLGFHVFTRYDKVTFFQGTSLRPVPPGGTGKDARWIDIHEDDLDEAKIATWVKQAAAMPGGVPADHTEGLSSTLRNGTRAAAERPNGRNSETGGDSMQRKFPPVAVLALVLTASGLFPAANSQGEDQCQRIPTMIQALESEDPEVRLRAVQDLAESAWANQVVRDALSGVLGDPERLVRIEAAIALHMYEKEENPAIAILVEAFPEESGRLQERIACALGGYGPGARRAVPALIEALREGKGDIRRWAGHGLEGIGPDAAEAVPALIEAIGDEDLRYSASGALRRIGPAAAAAVPALTAVLEDRKATCRANVAQALGGIGPAAAPSTPALANALREGYREGNQALLETAAIALVEIGPDGHRHLLDALCDDDPAFVAEVARASHEKGAPGYVLLSTALCDERAGPHVAPALLNIGEGGIWILARAVQGQDEAARGLAMDALADLQDRVDVAIRAIREELDKCRGAARYASIEVLGNFGPKGGAAVHALENFLNDDRDPRGRVLAARALGRIGAAAEPVLPKLQLLSDCEDPEMREAATEAVKRILAARGERASK